MVMCTSCRKLKEAEHDIGISRVTLRKYMAQLGIEPRSWHVGDRSLYISQAEKERIQQLKQRPSLLEQLRREQVSSQPSQSSPPAAPPVSSPTA